MSVKISVSIDAAAPKAALDRIAKVANDRANVNRQMADAVERLVRGNIATKYKPRDKRGITFWADVEQSVESESDEAGAVIRITELGFALRHHGGEVRPGKTISSFSGKPTRALAIPTDQVGVIRRRPKPPRESGLLAFMKSAVRGDTIGVLVEGQEKVITRGKNKGRTRIVPKPGGKLLYILREVTRHKEDPKTLPDEAAIQFAAQTAVQRLIYGSGGQ